MFHVEHRRMDYHLHTNHSMDGRQTMPELCETMLARGVQEIALTEHIEPGHPEEEMDVPPVWADWFAEIARCRAAYPALIIRSGIEIGDNPLCRAETKALLDTLPLDFRLLSLHLVNGVDCYDSESISQAKRVRRRIGNTPRRRRNRYWTGRTLTAWHTSGMWRSSPSIRGRSARWCTRMRQMRLMRFSDM